MYKSWMAYPYPPLSLETARWAVRGKDRIVAKLADGRKLVVR